MDDLIDVAQFWKTLISALRKASVCLHLALSGLQLTVLASPTDNKMEYLAKILKIDFGN